MASLGRFGTRDDDGCISPSIVNRPKPKWYIENNRECEWNLQQGPIERSSMLSVEMLSKEKSWYRCEQGGKDWTKCPPHADAKEDFSPNFGDDTPNTKFGLTRCSHTPHHMVSVLVCQSVAGLSAKSRTFTIRLPYATGTSHRLWSVWKS